MSNLPQKPLDNQGQFVTVFHGEINQTTEMLCNARDLHKFLGVQSKFAEWINRRIKEYGFVKSQDFVIISEISETMTKNGQRRATTSKQYHITLDMAKELAMVEKNAKGREIRRYFIDCEKKVLNAAQSLTAQITHTSLTLEHVDGNLSHAGRYLVTHGKKTKPMLKAKLAELLAKAQPLLPFMDCQS